MFCPSCYLDCAKSTRTDSEGRFAIANVSDALKFQVLITAPGHKSYATKLIDPAKGDLDIHLEPSPAIDHPERVVRGRVVDDAGRAVEGALVEPTGGKSSQRRWYGTVKVEPTVCDAEGRFELVLPADMQAVDIEVSVSGKAGFEKSLLEPGKEEIELTIPTGTRVTGRLVDGGEPVAGLGIAVVQLNRDAAHHFIKAVACTTDEAGRFDFNYLPANERYAIFTLVGYGSTANRDRVLSTKLFSAKGNNETRDLGDLSVLPAVHIRGRLEFPAGVRPPADAKLMLDRDPAWDLIAIPIAPDGTFEADGLPPETYELAIKVKNFEVDGTRINYQLTGPQSIGIHVSKSIDGLSIPVNVK
jgi:hypothetical protein